VGVNGHGYQRKRHHHHQRRVMNVSSSAIANITYDEQTRNMSVVFKDGRSYAYSMVPSATHRAFMVSQSKGKYFNSYIRKKFNERKIR
jgi:hypothetical protein